MNELIGVLLLSALISWITLPFSIKKIADILEEIKNSLIESNQNK